jgi:hypothetical protein
LKAESCVTEKQFLTFSTLNSKGKGKVHPRTGHEGAEGEERYSYNLSLITALDGVGGQYHVPAALPPGKTQYKLYRRLGGPQSRSGQVRKISLTPGPDPWTTLINTDD